MQSQHTPVTFRSIQIVHAALVLGSFSFIGITYYLKTQGVVPFNNDPTIALYAELFAPLFAMVAIGVISFWIYKKRVTVLKDQTNFDAKMELYRQALIVRYAGIEMATFFCIICYMLTGKNNLILYAIILVVLLIYIRPLKPRIKEELSLSDEDITQF